jgi:hypothetical protein
MVLFGRNVDAELVALDWHRTITIEKQRWLPRKDSTSQPPRNARNVQERYQNYTEVRTEWRTEKQYVNGQEQTVKRQVAIPETKERKLYTYEVPVWIHSRTVRAVGKSKSGIRWPEFTLNDDEREAKRTQSYYAQFTGASPGKDGLRKKYPPRELHEMTWRSLEIGATYTLLLGIFGRIREIGPAASPHAPS